MKTTSKLLGLILVLAFAVPLLASAERSDSKESKRPKIGLALGGGGALGISHVGVIRALEEMRIPIDVIAGTSMGAIVGGMYASGMSPDEMERSLIEMNWWDVMKDKTSRRDMQYRRKRDDSRYMLDFELGLNGSGLTMPHGLASGQKFNNVIQSMTVNAAGISDFNKLNIPFHATGTDIRTGGLVVLTNGNLGTAMRASMAVPGAFTPVTIDGKLLIDGGIVDNLPVDVARAMGADVVIAVDVGKLSAEAMAGTNMTFESLGEILSRTYDIMRRPDQDRMGKTADILVAPDTSAFSASDFQGAAKIIPTGVDAVALVSNQLAQLAVDEKTFQAFLDKQRKRHEHPMVLKSITVTNNQRVSTPVILAQVRSRTNAPVDVKAIEKDASRVYGLGNFQNVTYELKPETDGYDLTLDTREKYWGPGYLRFGLRLETDGDHGANWGMLLNNSWRQLNGLGGEVQLDLELGSDQRVDLEWFQPLNPSGLLFLAPALNYQSELLNFYSNRTQVAEYERIDKGAAVDLGSELFSWGEIRAGLYFGNADIKRKTGAEELPDADEQVAAWTTEFALDRLDDAVFATKGYLLNLRGFFADENLGSDSSYSKVLANGVVVKSYGRNTFTAGGGAGHSLGTDVPLYDQFTLGGFRTLPGLAPGQLRGPYYALGSLSYRFRLGSLSPSMGDGVYYILKGAMGNVWQDEDDVDLGDLVGSVATGLGADTAFGPMVFAVGFAEDESIAYYFSIGTLF
jgi:NTE family protein